MDIQFLSILIHVFITKSYYFLHNRCIIYIDFLRQALCLLRRKNHEKERRIRSSKSILLKLLQLWKVLMQSINLHVDTFRHIGALRSTGITYHVFPHRFDPLPINILRCLCRRKSDSDRDLIKGKLIKFRTFCAETVRTEAKMHPDDFLFPVGQVVVGCKQCFALFLLDKDA